MAKTWVYKFGENTIKVTNDYNGSELYINDQLQDKKRGLSLQDNLCGTLESGESVAATLGGTVTMKCSLLINNVLQEPVEIK